MDIDQITIGEARTLARMFSGGTTTDREDGGVRIVILQRGWVVVGHYFRDGEQVRVENAAVIRQWGTTKGLGELAASGKTSTTVLDESPTVRCHVLAVLATMDCTHESWGDRL